MIPMFKTARWLRALALLFLTACAPHAAPRTAADRAETDTAPLRLSAVLARLDEIRRELDRDDLDLEDQLVLYREGCTHAVAAKRILNSVRAEVDMLMEGADAVHTRGIEAS